MLPNDELAMSRLIITHISKRIPPADLEEKKSLKESIFIVGISVLAM